MSQYDFPQFWNPHMRGPLCYNPAAVRSILHSASADDYRFTSIVMGIVNSVPFEMRMKITQPVESTAGIEVATPSRAATKAVASASADFR